MSKITVEEAKRKYNLVGKEYDFVGTWDALSCLPVPEELIREAKNKVNWGHISKYSILSEEFVREFQNYVDWYCVSKYQKLSETFIHEFRDEVDWGAISAYQKLSENFIREHQNYVGWYYVSKYQKLSETFIHEFRDEVDWDAISAYQKLSENFIREHQNYVGWTCISIYQPLSEDFIREFADRVNWWFIPSHQVVSKEFLQEFDYELDNNSNKPESYWKERVQETRLYECHEDFFYAYKGIRSDRYSAYNFQYQYFPGETYECFSDYSDDIDSFGLSAWTKEKATGYCNELVVKVKVCYKDVTAVVYRGGKIRCKRLTVLE